MTANSQTAGLTRGLRALEKFGALAPIHPLAFAQSIGVGPVEATELLETFEAHGYARRVPGGGFFVLTRPALRILKSPNPAGWLVSHAIEPIVAAGNRLGQVVALSIPRGRGLMCCAVSRCCTVTGMSPGLRRPWPDPAKPAEAREIAVSLFVDGKRAGCLSIHFATPFVRGEEEGFRRELDRLAEQIARDIAECPARTIEFAWPEKAQAAVPSAMLH
ncbi:hypothetical protein [Novosphingobium sp. Gsoil 351]|uniref:hypothetical protein n=1 Tax=Novosphingobium sp. Gsoil 351 TaxID=2675225 RepID=UPI0012B44E79|nr:hypothetical protein [Novosphingobium sp. Gsoil 351]QGN55853.1 hypothetical protein GKE62_16150 [Novosphingobium sp. Gsoil 351]